MNIAKALFLAFLLALFTFLAVEGCRERNCVKAIVGEASGEGYDGMYAIACAIRNRGTLEGVYGLNAPHVTSETPKTYRMARKAWRSSQKGIDVTYGSTHWESTDFPTPSWAKDMTFTVQIGRHLFYK